MSFGRGCTKPLIEPHRHRLSFRMHAAMGATPPASYDQRESGLVAAVKDQGGSSSCESHSGSGATETCFALAGQPLGFIPSEEDWYRGLRALDRARSTLAGQTLPPLTDNGGMTEDAIAFAATFGIRPRRVQQTSDGRNSDVEMATVNDELALGDLEEDATHIIVGPYAIDPKASDAEQQVQSALAAKIPVRVDTYVDSVFENWSPGQAPVPPPNDRDPVGGGHAIYLVGYRPDGFIVRNSWGTSWGESGDVLVSSAWLRSSWGLYPWTCSRRAS